MIRKKLNKRKRLYYYLDINLTERFQEHVELVGYENGKLIEKILIAFLKKNNK